MSAISAAQLVEDRVRALPTTEDADILAKQLLDSARRPATDVAAMMKNPDPTIRRKARSVLNYMEEAAVGPLLDPKSALAPEDESWRLMMLAETVVDLRKKAAKAIDARLSDVRAVPDEPSRREEREPSRRICDDAYAVAHQLIGALPVYQLQLQTNRFLRLRDAQKDAEIRTFRRSPEWRKLLN